MPLASRLIECLDVSAAIGVRRSHNRKDLAVVSEPSSNSCGRNLSIGNYPLETVLASENVVSVEFATTRHFRE
jgi:hypothetical protein